MQRTKVVERPTISKPGAALVVARTVSLVAVLPAQADRPDRLRWQDCHEEAGPDFECATEVVSEVALPPGR
jgi:hypothetical protein